MRSLCLVLSAFILAVIVAPAAWAHAHLAHAVPAAGAEVSPAPKQIELWFNELLEDGFNTVTVFPAAELNKPDKRSNLTKGKPVVDAHDRTHLTVAVSSLAPGEYVIEWRVPLPGRS